jgi:7-cyano-7-deazaguanine synthase in queuosine biosynthesis
MMFAVSRHVMKRAMQLMNRQLMAVESYNTVVSPGRRTVVVLSAGVDSTTAFALARRDGGETYALTVHYGQRHAAEIVRCGLALGVDYGLTLSCDDPAPGGRPCRRCDACRLRRKGFEEAGIADPAA